MEEGHQVVAERVRQLMEQRGWSYAQVGSKAGLDPTTVWKIATGKTPNPGKTTLEKISGAFGLKSSELTGDTEPPPQLTVYSGVVWVPYVERSVHAGTGGWRESSSGRTPLSEEQARGHKRLYAGRVTGECMEPDVMSGATVIWDPDMRHPTDGQQVVVSSNGDLMVKLAYHDEHGGYLLVSHDGQEMRPNGIVLEGVVVKVTNDPRRGPHSLAEYRRQRDARRIAPEP